MDVILPILLSLSVLVGQMDYTKTDEFKKIIQNVERWRPLIEEVKSDDGRENVPTDLALAVIAQESKGLSRIISQDKYKSVGLMQIIPRDWVGTTEQLKDPRFNIEWGLWFLEQGLEYCDGKQLCALRVFNCGPKNALETFCGTYYADLVMRFWRPYFRPTPLPVNPRLYP
jgi:soluble lytic murein transglycosylase-like protein